eukprot:UN28031
MNTRFGHSYYFDWEHVSGDFITFGLLSRPWDRAKRNEKFATFGYYNIDSFVPHKWQAAYTNEAFDKMDMQDAFWMSK